MEETLMPVYQEHLPSGDKKLWEAIVILFLQQIVRDYLTWSALLMHIDFHKRP